MNTIEEFKEVLNTFGKFSNFDKKIEVQSKFDVHSEDEDETVFVIDMYTDRHKYNIKAIERKNKPGYLGCIADTRKPNAGQRHTRGNDLTDGPLCLETWHQILGDIVSYELVPLFKHEQQPTIQAETACSLLK